MGVLTENLVQDVATEEYMTPEAIALVNAAKALAPRLLERAHQTDEEGIVPTESVKEMTEAGLFRALQPKRWGGYELD
ncbi:MAG: flavin-dependent monooxygenase, partial [Oceanospirillaceae bacterium]|nr:flavin-dependent monooxygenase [Oceanospirillaceae bacterium]